MERFIRRQEAADMLGVSVRTLSRWHRTGVLRAVRIGPRLVGYDAEDLRRFTTRAADRDDSAGGAQ